MRKIMIAGVMALVGVGVCHATEVTDCMMNGGRGTLIGSVLTDISGVSIPVKILNQSPTKIYLEHVGGKFEVCLGATSYAPQTSIRPKSRP